MKKLIAWGVVALMAGSASASLTTTYTTMDGIADVTFAATQSVAVAAGDVIVMFSGTNKKPSANTMSYSTTSGDSFTSIHPWVSSSATPKAAPWMAYTTITTAGTYDFFVTGTGAVADRNGIYKLTSSTGVIAFLDSDAQEYAGVADGTTGVLFTNSLSWAPGTYGDIAVIGGIGVNRAEANSSVNLTVDDAGNYQRYSASTTISGATSFNVVWGFDDVLDTKTNDGGYLASSFAEVIPEPATMGMVVAMGAGALFIRRRFMI